MPILSTSTAHRWERNPWVSESGAVQAQVNDVIWQTLAGVKEGLVPPPAETFSAEASLNLREVIAHGQLEGLVTEVWGDKLKKILGVGFYEATKNAWHRTELFLQEVAWLVGPNLGQQTILIDDYAVRPYYAGPGGDDSNPRFINLLTFWTPTLATRDDVIGMLAEMGFEADPTSTEGYLFRRQTEGGFHRIHLRGTAWAPGKNWTLDLEHEIWDRALAHSTTIPLRLEVTDLFMFATRRFSIDSLSGGALFLRDIVTLIDRSCDDIDWDRLRKVTSSLHKPDWFWAAMVALTKFEAKAGRTLPLPKWIRDELNRVDSFWYEFVTSRLNWSNPDQRLVDFPRAFVKAAKGT